MHLSTPAIVLKKRNIGETDRVYSFLTREFGKMRATARGVRKPEAKLAGQIETLNFVHLSVMKGRGRGNVAGAIAESHFTHIRENETSLRAALEGVALFDGRVEDDEPDRELFELLLGFLRALDAVGALPAIDERDRARRSQKIFLLSQGFSWKLFHRLGYGVELYRCALGHEDLMANERYSFSPDAGGVVCTRHMSGARIIFPFSENAVKALRMFVSEPLSRIVKLSLDAETLRVLRNALRSFLDWTR